MLNLIKNQEKGFTQHHFRQIIFLQKMINYKKYNISIAKFSKHESGAGFIASLNTILILIFILSIAMSMSILIFGRQKISTNTINSTQSYYTAEAGAEDALLRLKNNPQMSPLSYSLTINNSTDDIVIPAIIGGSRSITSQGNNNGLIKTSLIVYAIDNQGISFHYGAQVGDGGLIMGSNTEVEGNVFSTGNISGSGNSSKIDNSVIIAGNGHILSNVNATGDALVYSCNNSTIQGNLTYVVGGSNNCTVSGTTSTQSGEIASQPLPISQSQINGWKSDATDGGTIASLTIGNNQTISKGPIKITGNLSFGNGSTLNITGTIYVQGNIIFGNNNTIKLDTSYGSLSGIILSDGTISTSNNTVLKGSGQTSSHLLVLSTNTSDLAITVNNNAEGAIFYTTAGGIKLSNNVKVKEVTGYKLIMNNNSKINFESGLADTFFSSGPGGAWKVKSWQEQ